MFKSKSLFFILTETPVHAGAGESVGHVDLPLQRDVVKEIPIIQPSEIKGPLRDYLTNYLNLKQETENPNLKQKTEILFGPEEKGDEYSSCISFTEAKILFFPVKSIYGIFAYITSPLVLNEFFRLFHFIDEKINFSLNEILQYDTCYITNSNSIITNNNKVYLGEFVFNVQQKDIKINDKDIFEFFKDIIFPDNEEYKYWKDNFPKRTIIVSDNMFKDLVNLSTEVVTRNRINDQTGVVDEEEGGLWDEENLPSDTILYSGLFVIDPYKKNEIIKDHKEGLDFLRKNLDKNRVQIGGHKTIGRGFIFINFYNS